MCPPRFPYLVHKDPRFAARISQGEFNPWNVANLKGSLSKLNCPDLKINTDCALVGGKTGVGIS